MTVQNKKTIAHEPAPLPAPPAATENNEFSVVIVDDETPARELIRHYLQSYPCLRIAGEAANGFDAMKLIKEQNPHLLFLDIQMPKLTGFELLELLEVTPEIIFSTAFDQHALRAFELNAVDYLLKPYSKERFDQAIQKALAKITSGNDRRANLQALAQTAAAASDLLTRVAVKDRQQIHVIPIGEIACIEADGDYVKLHTAKGAFLKEKTMKYFDTCLPPQQFIRIHRSFIVNVDEVAKIELFEKEAYRVHLKNGDILRASSTGYKRLKELVRL
ncbi:MAG: LytTR family transcriptional regulator DNA-binding domain-containing protein [Prevotellaceae bacterium]|jgi:two-component system LytT family response regulator|nr:LytTR family transcriptional regulator DNA-binding domain-containing protein [Prevotellaceae bacterium]